MKYAQTWTTLIAYSPLPDQEAIVADLAECGFHLEIRNLEIAAGAWSRFELFAGQQGSLVRVVRYPLDGSRVEATAWMKHIVAQLMNLPAT